VSRVSLSAVFLLAAFVSRRHGGGAITGAARVTGKSHGVTGAPALARDFPTRRFLDHAERLPRRWRRRRVATHRPCSQIAGRESCLECGNGGMQITPFRNQHEPSPRSGELHGPWSRRRSRFHRGSPCSGTRTGGSEIIGEGGSARDTVGLPRDAAAPVIAPRPGLA